MNLEIRYKRVIETLKLVAASAKEQEIYLPKLSYVPTDVTSSFEDVYLLLPILIEEGLFSNKSIAWILRAYIQMQWCLANVDLKDFSSDDWNKVRDFAKEALLAIGEPPGKPDLEYI